MNDTFGKHYKLTDWGDTHGTCLEGRIEGCPAGVCVPAEFVVSEMARRAPSLHALSTRRTEDDPVEFLSGLDGERRTTGEPIHFRIPNRDVRVNEANRHVIRPSHASFSYFKKYGYEDN